MDANDDSERPTLPGFDMQVELFLSDAPTWPEFAPVILEAPKDDPVEWWADQRRRALRTWVTATMALCAGLLAAAVLLGPLAGG